MPRFFVGPENINNGKISVTGDDCLHIGKTLRMKPGERITVCDKCGTDYECTLFSVSKTEAICDIISSHPNESEPCCKVTIFQSLPKGSKMDFIVQKSVEVGIHKIIPVLSSRVIAAGTKSDRWNKLSLEAAKQSGRGEIPEVAECMSFDTAVTLSKSYDLALIPYECERDVKLSDVLKQYSPTSVCFFIGPEGGFEKEEIEKAVENGIVPVSLGKRILRTETAGIVVLSGIFYQYE